MEYQYYEFQAVDKPLDKNDIKALRALSTRARITATSFTNHYDWGDFKGDPRKLMERWFDLHLYLANWGSRQLMIRLPRRIIDQDRLDAILRDVRNIDIHPSGENLIFDIYDDEEPPEYNDWDDGSGWLGSLAPLRSDLLAGDWRMFYLLWLREAQIGTLQDDDREPLTGTGPLNGGLEAFADFFRIDTDLVQAAAEESPCSIGSDFSTAAIHDAVASIPDEEKTELLARLAGGDPYVGPEVQSKIREILATISSKTQDKRRTVVELRDRAAEIRKAREVAEAKRQEAIRQQREREAEQARRKHLNILKHRGLAVWDEVEREIEKRNANGYERATELLIDLRFLAGEDNNLEACSERLRALRLRHARKTRFIERLEGLEQV